MSPLPSDQHQWKGKGKAADSNSNSDSEPITQEYLESLLEKARRNVASGNVTKTREDIQVSEEEVITLENNHTLLPLPPIDLGTFNRGESSHEHPASFRDPGIECVEQASASLAVPEPPIPPPELTKSGKPLTKNERKALRNKTAGPGWFDLPAPAAADLPRLYREVEALRLRNHLDPKRFYRKDEAEGKGIKGLPKYFAIGTIVQSTTPFGTASTDNLTRANRKRTLVDELVEDAEAKHYAKKKFEELQKVRGAKGRGTLAQRQALRRRKF